MPETLTIAVSKGRILKESLPLLARMDIVPLEDPDISRNNYQWEADLFE